MKKKELTRIERAITGMTDPELAEAAGADRDRYVLEAQDAIRREVERRAAYNREHNPIYRKASTDLFSHGFRRIDDTGRFAFRPVKYAVFAITLVFVVASYLDPDLVIRRLPPGYGRALIVAFAVLIVSGTLLYHASHLRHFYRRRTCPQCGNGMLRVSPDYGEPYTYKYICDRCRLFIDTEITPQDERMRVSPRVLFWKARRWIRR